MTGGNRLKSVLIKVVETFIAYLKGRKVKLSLLLPAVMKRKKNEFEDGMPLGSRVTMNESFACVATVVLMYWLKNNFVPRREPANVLDFAAENDTIQLCLLSDTTHYLRPLFWSFFKPLTTFWQQAVNNWLQRNPSRKITRLHFGGLLTVAWNQAETVGNDSAGFSAC